MHSIGELARQTGTKVPTIRYYETIGILKSPERTSGNQRRYDNAAKERLHFIRHARALGFQLAAIRELVELGEDATMPCATAHTIAASHLSEVRKKRARLEQLERELSRIVELPEHGCIGTCAVLACLGDHELCADDH